MMTQEEFVGFLEIWKGVPSTQKELFISYSMSFTSFYDRNKKTRDKLGDITTLKKPFSEMYKFINTVSTYLEDGMCCSISIPVKITSAFRVNYQGQSVPGFGIYNTTPEYDRYTETNSFQVPSHDYIFYGCRVDPDYWTSRAVGNIIYIAFPVNTGENQSVFEIEEECLRTVDFENENNRYIKKCTTALNVTQFCLRSLGKYYETA